MSVKDNPSLEFERYINGRQQHGSLNDQSGQIRQQKGKNQGVTTPQGAPSLDFTVRSVYDSRPINGYDFNSTASVSEPPAPGNTIITVFRVPPDYVCIPRIWHHWFSPLPAGIERQTVKFTLLVNNIEVPNNRSIPVGIESDEIIHSFFIADENSSIAVDVRIEVALPAGTAIFIHLYGNLLLKTGVPAQFQIANLAGKIAPIPLIASTIVSPRPSLPLPKPRTTPPPAPIPARATPVRRRFFHAAKRR